MTQALYSIHIIKLKGCATPCPVLSSLHKNAKSAHLLHLVKQRQESSGGIVVGYTRR